MKILMLKTTPGSVDGINVKVYEADVEYNLGGSPGSVDLAKALVGARLAEDVDVDSPSPAATPMPEPEEKSSPAPENKAVPAAPENKGRGRRKA